MSAHPRQLDLERLSAGEPVAASAHVDGCAQCQAVVAELRDASRAFVVRRPARVLHEVAAQRTSTWWRGWWPVGLLALAAAAVLITRPPLEPEVRFKGAGLSLFVTRESTTAPLAPGQSVRAGDQLTFSYQAITQGVLLVLEVERGKGPVVLASSPPLAANETFRAPQAFELDDTTADEWVVAIFSPHPVTPDLLVLPVGELPRVQCPDCQVEVRRLERAR